MNRRLVIAIVAIAGVLIAAVAGLAISRALTTSAVADPTPSASSSSSGSPTPTSTPSEATTPGVYVDYSDTAIADAAGRVVLFFHAPWCGQCVQLEKDILAEGVPDGVTVIKVDWDTNQALEQQYGVPMRTTFVELGDDGSVLQLHVAYEQPRFANVVAAMNL
jgi:thiol-disulfide isomerase/thioredoxin